MEQLQSNKIKEGKIWPQFFKYVSLSVLSMIGLSAYILADTFFIANGVGENGLAALNLVIPVYSFINGLGLMFGMGGATRFAILHSSGNKPCAAASIISMFMLCLTFGIVFLLSGLFGAGFLSRLLGANEFTFAYAKSYLGVIMAFSPMFLLNNLAVCTVRNDHAPQVAMLAMLTGSLSNIVLDYVFIYPLNMGMFGAALATGLAPVISLCVLSPKLFSSRNKFLQTPIKLSFNDFKECTAIGFPSFITEFSSGIVILCFNFVILSIAGNIGVAAYGIIANLAIIAVSIFTGVAQGIQPLISTRMGQNDLQGIKRILRLAFIMVFLLGIGIYSTVLIIPAPIVNVFNGDNNPILAEMAVNGLRIYFLSFLMAGFNIATASYFASILKPTQSFSIATIRGIAAVIPLVFTLPRWFGMYGVWAVVPIAEGIALITALTLLYYSNYSKLREKKNTKHIVPLDQNQVMDHKFE